MRHDFRYYYGCKYETVDIDEAVDLIKTLPDGSLYISKVQPKRAWSESRQISADLQDLMVALLYASKGVKDDPPKVSRPADIVNTKSAREKSRNTKTTIENTEWEEV